MDGILYIGSVWQNPNGNRNVPMLWSNDRERNANLNWLDNMWNANYRFLAVGKMPYVYQNKRIIQRLFV